MKIATTLAAALLAASVGVTSLATATPATAGGQLTIKIKPKGRDARALRTGLAILGVVQGLQNKARVRQYGNGNASGIAQNGSGNGALLVQNGNNHTGTIVQNGNRNGCALIQFGKGTNGSCTQNGNGQFGLILQGGW